MSAVEDPGQKATRLLVEAMQQIAEGHFVDAIARCQDASAVLPYAPQPYHGMATAFMRLGDVESALDAIAKAVAAAPDNLTYVNEWVRLLVSVERGVESALAAIAQVTAAAPDDPTYVNQWARMFVAIERDGDAVAILSAATHVVARNLDLMSLWGLCLCRLGRYEDAAVKLGIYLEQYPDNRMAHRNLSFAYQGLGEMERAVDAFSASAPPFDPDAPSAPRDLEADYIELAKSYDDNDLHIGIARQMATFIETHAPVPETAVVLECCCGSGLAGVAMQGRFGKLIGIDLSAAMLERAAKTGVYDSLIEGDMVAEMIKLRGGFDLVFCSDALMYFHRLDGFFAEAHRLLMPGGGLVFSTDPSNDAADVRCTGPGEYAHSRAYLRRLAADTGFTEITLQAKKHRAYPGFWGAFRKPATDGPACSDDV